MRLGTDWWLVSAAWAGAIGTVGALFTALAVFTRDARSRRSAQAQLVTAWAQRWKYAYKVGEDPAVEICDLCVRNSSAQAVQWVRVAVLPWDWDRSAKGQGVIFGTLAPETTTNPQDISRLAEAPPPGMGEEPRNPPLQMTFTDSSGRRWCRWPDGYLEDLGTAHHRRRWWRGR